MLTTAGTTNTAQWASSATSATSQDKSDRTALLSANNPSSAAAIMNYGSCGGAIASSSNLQRPTILSDLNGETISSIEEFVEKPQPPPPPKQQPQPPSQPKKATLLSLAAKAAASLDSSTPSAARLDDIMRKGIDIAREFDASAFTGRPNIIKLVVADNTTGGSRRQSMFEWASGVSESDVHVVIEMPPDDYTIPEDEPTSGGCGSADEGTSRWRRRRQRNHSDSSKTPLISDA